MGLSNRVSITLAVGLLGALAWSAVFGGMEARHRTFDPPVSGWDNGYTLGSRYFWVREGSRITVDYDATVSRGAFHVYVKRFRQGLDGVTAGRWRTGTSSGGQGEAVIPESGIYYIHADGESTPGSRGYDIRYKVRWRIEQKLWD